MPWPTWDQAGAVALVLVVLGVVGRRVGSARALRLGRAAEELARVSSLYMVWRLAHQLPLVQDTGAAVRGRQVWRLEQAMHLPSELAIERWVLEHHWLAEVLAVYYATAHVPVLIGFLVWLYLHHRGVYRRWRNALAITTGFCLFIRFVRVAPPRLLPELGFVDMAAVLGKSVYGPVGTGVSDQYAAMPSIHVAWAAIVAFGAWQATINRWRWLGVVHLAMTSIAVVATANHWWMDGIVAVALLGVALLVDDVGRLVLERPRSPSVPPAPAATDDRPALEHQPV